MALTDVKSEQIQSSVALAGSPTTTTQSASDNSTKIATTAYVETAVANLVASAPAALNTLDELAAALNDDASFSTTVTNSIATKLPLAGGTLTGDLIIGAAGTSKVLQVKGTSNQDIFLGTHAYGTSLQAARHPTTGTFSNTGVAAAAINLEVANADSSLTFWTSDTNNVVPTKRMTIDKNGNVGIGVTPSASHYETLELGNVGCAITGRGPADTHILSGLYWDGASTRKYAVSGVAVGTYQITNGAHYWSSPAAGTAGNTATVSANMTLDGSGNLGIGITTPSARLDVVGGGTSTSPTLELNSSTSNGFNHAINAFNSNLTAGENNIFIIGKEGSTKNSGYIGYKWNGAGSNTNLVTFGHWASDNLMNLTADGRLGIGTQTPASYDTDGGGISADLVVANSGHAGIVVASGTGSDAGIFFGDGTGNAAYRGAVSYVNNQERLYFKANGTNYLTLDNARLNAMGINLDVGVDTATVNFTDSVSNGNTKYIEIGANGASSLGDALLVTHSSGSGVGYFGYESGNDRLIIACDNGGGNNSIEFSVDAGTATGGSTDNLNSAVSALTIHGSKLVTMPYNLFVDAYKGSNQGISGWTKVTYDQKTGTNNTGFNTGGTPPISRFTAPVAGKYLVSVTCYLATANIPYIYTGIWKNGSAFRYIHGQNSITTGTDWTYGGTIQIYLAQNDYIEHWAYSNGSATLGSGQQRTSFSIYLIG